MTSASDNYSAGGSIANNYTGFHNYSAGGSFGMIPEDSFEAVPEFPVVSG